MTTLYLHHPAALEHKTPMGHPERPDRIRAIEKAVAAKRFSALQRVEAPEADTASVVLAHPEPYVRAIAEAAPQSGRVQLDADTTMSPGT
jgi:acetoin utilization deacetylase AcuC-like enzyme